ncbi:hypothetical protein ABKV19_015750 [Rosa sericea]
MKGGEIVVSSDEEHHTYSHSVQILLIGLVSRPVWSAKRRQYTLTGVARDIRASSLLRFSWVVLLMLSWSILSYRSLAIRC